MIFKVKKHDINLYNTLLNLSRNFFFYNKICLKDTFETRIYLMFIHFSIILIIYKKKEIKFPQKVYDNLFHCIENNLRELGFGDVSVNKKMKDLNKVFYDILLKLNNNRNNHFEINEKVVFKYYSEFNNLNDSKYKLFISYFLKFYNFCFELQPEIMIKEAINFKV